jgi:acyl-CoA dehydrogenase
MFGGLGVVRGMAVERLYRDVRALRIYEGTSEVLKLIIASRVLEAMSAGAADGNDRRPPRSAAS